MLPSVDVDENKRKIYQNETNFFANKDRFFDDVKFSFFKFLFPDFTGMY